MVIADTPGLAEDALEYVEVDIEPLQAVASRKASSTDKSLLFPDYKTNLAKKFTGLKETPMRHSRAHYKATAARCAATHGPADGAARLLADWRKDEKRLTVYGAGKVLFFNAARSRRCWAWMRLRLNWSRTISAAALARGEFIRKTS